jgi:hypothetical protein
MQFLMALALDGPHAGRTATNHDGGAGCGLSTTVSAQSAIFAAISSMLSWYLRLYGAQGGKVTIEDAQLQWSTEENEASDGGDPCRPAALAVGHSQ